MDYADKNVFLTRAFPGGSHFQFTDDHVTWPQGWLREYDPATGIPRVTIDMGFPQFQTEFEKAEQDFCRPISFCTLKGKNCHCNEDGDFVKLCKDNNICSTWAGKDIDWPDGGVYGFGVTFPGNFAPDEQDHRPTGPPAGCLKADTPGWNVPLVRTKEALRGACADTPISPPKFCM